MSIFNNKKVVNDRDFTDCELFKTVGEYKVYYPTSEKKMREFSNLIETYGKDDKDGITISDKEAFMKLFEVFTNVNMDEKRYEANKDKLELRLSIVSNYIKRAMLDTLELLESTDEILDIEDKLDIKLNKDKDENKVEIDNIDEVDLETETEDTVEPIQDISKQLENLKRQIKELEESVH